MPSASYVQTNFSAGEFSAAFQGRMDDEDYKKGLALCLNYIPGQEQSLRARSGFKRCGITKNNEPGKLMPFRFTIDAPYVSEFTDGNLRLWSCGIPILDTQKATVVSVTGNPPVFTLNAVPDSWNMGDSILVNFQGTTDVQAAPYLGNREFLLNIVSRTSKTVRLTDALTGSPLSSAITFTSDFPKFYRILDLPTKYQFPGAVRQIENAAQNFDPVQGTSQFLVSQPDHKVTYLYPMVGPQSLSYEGSQVTDPAHPTTVNNSNLALQPESFIDGPYLDSAGTSVPLTVNGTTGTIEIVLRAWTAALTYQKGDCVVSYATGGPFYYLSLKDANKNNALPEVSPFVDDWWLQVNVNENQWQSVNSYDIAQHIVAAPYNAHGVGTLYYSRITSNLNHVPESSPIQWSTTPPVWNLLVAYNPGAFVSFSSVNYLAVGMPTTGIDPLTDTANWIAMPDMAAAVDTFMNQITGWLAGPLFYVDDAGGSNSTIGQTYGTNNPGRCIRLKWGPPPWDSKVDYAVNDFVNFNDVIYKSLVNPNLANYPDTDAASWEIQADTILWTWGRISDASSHMLMAEVDLIGPDLPDAGPIFEYRMGVYSDTTGWPKAGTYHEGRLWLIGTIPNRMDGGYSNGGFNFAPTAPDGTVSDANGISLTLNSAKLETMEALCSTTEGIVALTSEREWLVSASAMNDPITPTSVQAHPTTTWSAHPDEACRLPSAVAAIQRGGRRVMEYRNFVDMSAYQSRLNAADLTRRCQHLTAGGVGQTAYQSRSNPVIWVAPANKVTMSWQPSYKSICPINILGPVVVNAYNWSDLFGIGYMRSPDGNYTAPFSFEHGKTYISTYHQDIYSVAVQNSFLPGQENVYAIVNDLEDGNYYVEMMMPLFESAPLYDTYNPNGTVYFYGQLSQSFMVDAGVTPIGCRTSDDGLSCDFYGLMPHAGKTVSATIMGKYLGDVAVDANGTANIPFTSYFTTTDLARALNGMPKPVANGGFNENSTPGYFQLPLFDTTGPSILVSGTGGFFCQFGYKFRRRGQMNRPIVGGANGPAFAKITQNSRAGIYVDACSQIKAGGSFNSLVDIKLTVDGVKDTTPLTPGVHTTGIYRGFIKDGNTFDGRICWEQTDPVPGNILAVGGFDAVEDV